MGEVGASTSVLHDGPPVAQAGTFVDAPPQVIPDAPAPTAPPRRWQVRLTGLAAIAGGLWYLTWRPGTLLDTGIVGWVFLACELVAFAGLVFTVLLVSRARWRTEGVIAPPKGSLDLFITVCGEPLEMVERTIHAALAVAHPHETYVLNDNRMAGRHDWEAVEALCARLGVTCFTRTSGARGKAGNLNHALALTQGEFVATIDADHRAVPEFAHETLGYFVTSRIGFVATRQGFEIEGADSLNNHEPLFYGAIQPAKDRDHAAFSCGNATVWRRSALEGIGGFSEWNLVEDLHTSYRLHGAGWDSVYHPEAVTLGTAPTTVAEFAHQRLRWAIDTWRILIFDNPLRRGRPRGWKRVHYLHTTTSYPLLAANAVFLLGPALFLLGDLAVMRFPSDGEYLLHALPYPVLVLAFMASIVGFRSALRSLQAFLFAAPLYAVALLYAITGLRPRRIATAKHAQRAFSRLLVPQIAIAGALAAALVIEAVDPHPGGSPIAFGWAALLLALVIGPLTTVSEKPRVNRRIRAVGRGLVGSGVGVLAVLALLGAGPVIAWQDAAGTWSDGTETGMTYDGAAVWPDGGPAGLAPTRLLPPTDGAYLGAASPLVVSGPDGVDRWAEQSGTTPAIAHWFQQWQSGDTRFRGDWIDAVHAQGSVPMITWEPWAKPVGEYDDIDQATAGLDRITAGAHDDYIRSWAEAAAADGRPLLLRLMQEMNGEWYPWSVGHNGNTSADFVDAWRHVHDIFTEAGASNVSWVWTINELRGIEGASLDIDSFYPGDEYVDWVSVTGFNWGDSVSWSDFTSAAEIFVHPYMALARYEKPIMISETGTVDDGGDSAQWMRDFLEALPEHFDLVRAVVFFDVDYDEETDFRLDADDRAALADGGAGLFTTELETEPA